MKLTADEVSDKFPIVCHCDESEDFLGLARKMLAD